MTIESRLKLFEEFAGEPWMTSGVGTPGVDQLCGIIGRAVKRLSDHHIQVFKDARDPEFYYVERYNPEDHTESVTLAEDLPGYAEAVVEGLRHVK